jgi:7,8-dihydropterin-6-yl-methyl-4-(beta-D-ribofuranosyl)aminobenzene 5'-phosphate synthase
MEGFMRITILCENSVGRAIPAIGEHGFACWIEMDGKHYLVDSGQGLGIIKNAHVLDLPLNQLSGAVISHGHYDHVGGLDQVLRHVDGLEVFAHPDVFAERYSQGSHNLRFLGIPQRRELLETLGARFTFTPGFQQIADNLYVTGAIPRDTDFELGDANLVQRNSDGQFEPDPFNDDMAVVVESAKGLVVVLGCAHAGIINTLDYVCKQFDRDEVYAVVGGTHLGPVSAEQFNRTLIELKRFNIQKIGVSHCTGQPRAALLRNEFGKRFFYGSVGAVLDLNQ